MLFNATRSTSSRELRFDTKVIDITVATTSYGRAESARVFVTIR